jgi:catechol 2,3-dioxygenase-like lactoylglutathione lyase family enzyme
MPITITDANVTLMVGNMDKAIHFYQSIGLKLKDRWGDHYAMVTAPGITIGLHPSKEFKNSSGNASIGLFITDVAEARSLLKKNAVKFKEESGKSGHYFNFEDLDGNLLYFVKPGW